MKKLKIQLSKYSDLKLMLSVAGNFLSYQLQVVSTNGQMDLTSYIDSIRVDPKLTVSRQIKKKNNQNYMVVRLQGAKFHFSVDEGHHDCLLKVVLLIFLDHKGPSGVSLNGRIANFVGWDSFVKNVIVVSQFDVFF